MMPLKLVKSVLVSEEQKLWRQMPIRSHVEARALSCLQGTPSTSLTALEGTLATMCVAWGQLGSRRVMKKLRRP